MAARRLANNEGPCEKKGDQFGNNYLEILNKYYTYSASDVQYQTFKFDLGGLIIIYDGIQLLEQMLVQRGVDKSLLFSHSKHFGLGCSCRTDEKDPSKSYLYCVMATA